MTNKQFFKLSLGMLTMFLGLTGCLGSKHDNVSSDSRSNSNNIHLEQTPTTYLLVGFAGLGDPGTHPKDWLGKIENMIAAETNGLPSKPQILQLLIKRSSENMNIEYHATEANQQIVDYLLNQNITDFSNVKVIMVAESYGGLVALQCGRNNFNDIGINIAGLITIRTPYEGVPLVKAISVLMPYAQNLNQMVNGIGEWLNTYGQYQQALETLNPDSTFITSLKHGGLSSLDFPILALAGRDTQPTLPYKYLQILPLFQLVLAFTLPELAQELEAVSSLVLPYQVGNDGLVTTSSGIAANSRKGTSFQSHVLSNFPHMGNTTNHYQALSYVSDFVRKIVK